ncbi:MAG: hypothetical protein HYX89_07330 [Chloroflexi bacterium]|nr:hypothetical protein [Chloroflexota bacterium]
MADPDIKWEGASGKAYGYWIHLIGTEFKDEPGNYIYAKETEPNRWGPVYVGQTSSLAERLADTRRRPVPSATAPLMCMHTRQHVERRDAVQRKTI